LDSLSSAFTVREPSLSEVRNELQVLLAARLFQQSRGLAKLLRYLCAKAMVGDAEPITEYTIAVDVLGKLRDFKESKDAGVRVEVHRLRKRLAEYYEQEGAHHSIRIVIPTGQYTPQFLVCDRLVCDHQGAGHAIGPEPIVEDPIGAPVTPVLLETEPPPQDPSEIHPSTPKALPQPSRPASHAIRKQLWGAVGLVAVLGVVLASVEMWPGEPLDSFWHPVFSSPNPILICFGNVEGAQRSRARVGPVEGLTLLEYHGSASEMMLVPDAITVSRFTGLLQSKGKRYRLASQSEANFADLQYGPAVLIGLANNDWTERLVGKLRFTLEHRPPGKLVLRDSNNPAREDWAVDYREPYLSVTRDYALVVRVLDPKTEQVVVTAAGLSAFGTLAAGEFLTLPDEFRKIRSVAPKGWQQRNFELVLSTDVIRGKSGHPNIVAAHFW
jgi:hypothetical protein